MASAGSVLAMHKSYFCLLHLHDINLAITVALDHLKQSDDADLILTVLMEFISNYAFRDRSIGPDHVRSVFLQLMQSKNLVGLHRLLVKRHYDRARSLGLCNHTSGNRTAIRSGAVFIRPNGSQGLGAAWTRRKVNLSSGRSSITAAVPTATKRREGIERVQTGDEHTRRSIKRASHGDVEALKEQFNRNLVDCYGDKNMVYYSCEILHPFLQFSGSIGVSRVACMDFSVSGGQYGRIHEGCSVVEKAVDREGYITPTERQRHNAGEPLPAAYGQLCLTDDPWALMSRWRRQYTQLKCKMFQVCNMLFININVPFIAVDLFSRFFQKIVASTSAHVRRCLTYLFNRDQAAPQEEPRAHASPLTEDDVTMLFMLAANCLEIALNHHNGCPRFDIFSLFYFLVFVDSILTKTELKGSLGEALPSFTRLDDGGAVLQQKLDNGRHYLRRSLKYHHNLFKRELSHLAKELKKNRVLQVVNFHLVNCLEQLMLLWHGIFGLNLTLRIAPLLREATRSKGNVSTGKRSRCGHYGYDGPDGSGVMRCWTPSEERAAGCEDTKEAGCTDIFRRFIKRRRASEQRDVVNSQHTYPDDKDSVEGSCNNLSVEDSEGRPNDLDQANLFVTESTELSILLLHMLSCSSYIEILSGNGLFASPGCGLPASSLIASVTLRFVLDVYVKVTDEVITSILNKRLSRARAPHHDAAGAGYLTAFEGYMGDNYNLVDESTCVFYFLVLEIDWIFHKEGVYSGAEYAKHQRLMGSVLEVDEGIDRGSLGDAFAVHHRLYEQMAVLMLSGRPLHPCTSLCIEAFKSRVASWNTFDEVTVRRVRPEDEVSINREIMEIYYADIGKVRPCFNPYKSIFTTKYFAVTKDLIYRVKATLLLYYISYRHAAGL
ncbi:anaphase-promoting complex subunit CDC26, putative [Babesia caballi]|uniref:Anaphase-promoting complex subunit CDC26, putative n=1 Tax=Babesia caballi TaxID=5871 RepID=A0AAV4M0Y6_BABCB|nr:anaphase-promoting complex subunit CDC26, putative [Babesia caballi]